MVSPSPDLQRRMSNTNNIIQAKKAHLVSGLYQKYPKDYLDLDIHNALMVNKPWVMKLKFPLPPTKLKSSKSQESIKEQSLKEQSIKSLVGLSGGDKVLIICVDFSDLSHTIDTTTIYNRFFSNSPSSFKNYYNEVSYGNFNPTGVVIGWYRAPNPLSYYRDDPNKPCAVGIGAYPHNIEKLFEDVLDLVSHDSNVNLSSIDVDGDKKINRVFVVHAGGEAAYGGNCNYLWAYTSGINPKTIKDNTNTSYTFEFFSISAEYLYPGSPQVSGIDCHEFGHLALAPTGYAIPDLYDTGSPPQTNGVGYWSLMGFGNWLPNSSASSPCHFDAFCKNKFGWLSSLTTNYPGANLPILNIETTPMAYIYQTVDPYEYFIIENRQQTKFDSYLPGNGLLIWHIKENTDQQTYPYCHTVSLVQADNNFDLELKHNQGDNGDPYPGSSNKRLFTPTSSPNSNTCAGTSTGISITNISSSSSNMTMDVAYSPCITTPNCSSFGITPCCVIQQGSQINMTAVISNGWPNYTITFYKKSPTGVQTNLFTDSNIEPSNFTYHTYAIPLTDQSGDWIYGINVQDSCPSPSNQTCGNTKTITVTSTCSFPVCELSVTKV